MVRASARVSGFAMTASSGERVSAQIMLKERLPQSFTQRFSRIRVRTGARRPAPIISWESCCARSLFDPSGSPRSNRFE